MAIALGVRSCRAYPDDGWPGHAYGGLMAPVHALVAFEADPSAHSPLTSTFVFPAVLVLAAVVTIVAGVVALMEIGAAGWMPARQQTVWRRIVVGIPVVGMMLGFCARGRTLAQRAAEDGHSAVAA